MIKTPDGKILMHGSAPYDPKKAHDYYLRTRHLKGRHRSATTFTVKKADGSTVQLSSQQLAEEKVYAAKRVSDIKNKLNELGHELQKRMQKAKAADAKAKKGPTAADKHKAAKESKQYRDKHRQQISNKRKRSSTKKKTSESHPNGSAVEHLTKRIAVVKGKLITALEKQRSLASATKNG